MISLRLAFVFFFVFLVSSTTGVRITTKDQIQGCSTEKLNLEPCLDIVNNNDKVLNTSGFCCTVLNQAVEAGFHCLCTLLEPYSTPLTNIPLLLHLSNCFISSPPLTWCQALGPPEGRPLPVPSPPPPEKPMEPPVPDTLFLPPPPTPEVGVPVSSDLGTNSTVISSMNRNDFLISNANKIKDLPKSTAFLALIVCYFMIRIPAFAFIYSM